MAKVLDIVGISRRSILRKLITENYKNIGDFCKQSGEDYAAIYRYYHNDIKMSDKVIKRLEGIFNLPEGYFDQQLPKLTTVDIPIIGNTVKKPTMQLAEIIAHSSKYAMIEQRIMDEFKWSKAALFILIIQDNSMYPVIRDKAEVLVDGSQTEIENNKYYAVKINSDIHIRKLIKSSISGLITLIPENKTDFPTDEISLSDSFAVLGRVVYLKGAL